MMGLVQSLSALGTHYILDFPGFGKTPAPTTVWGCREYARHSAAFLRHLAAQHANIPLLWISHSFGGRVGLCVAAHHPGILDGMVLIAASGLKPRRPLHTRLWLWLKVRLFKTLKILTRLGLSKEWVVRHFTSGDYKNAGPLRAIFVKVVNEDLSSEARAVGIPALLIYAENDTATPPDMGKRLQSMMANARLFVLDGQDHFSILGEGRHPVAALIHEFVTERFGPP